MQEDIQQYFQLQEKIARRVYQIVDQIKIADPQEIGSNEFIGISGTIDDAWVYLRNYEFPASYLYDNRALKEYLDDLVLRRREREIEHQRRLEENRIWKERRDMINNISPEEYAEFLAWKRGK